MRCRTTTFALVKRRGYPLWSGVLLKIGGAIALGVASSLSKWLHVMRSIDYYVADLKCRAYHGEYGLLHGHIDHDHIRMSYIRPFIVFAGVKIVG